MPIPTDVDIALVLDKIRPAAAWRRCSTYQELIDTWEDQLQILPTEQEIIDAWPLVQADQAAISIAEVVRDNAKTQLSNIPNWATWDEATALAWFDANVNSAADAIPVLRALIRMTIALRNETWPGLQE